MAVTITLPIVNVTPDTVWATENNAALTALVNAINAQIHSSQITIDTDLSFNATNATNLRSTQFQSNVSTLSSLDVRALYFVGKDAYVNDGDGIPIRLTVGHALNTGALVLNVFAVKVTQSNLTIATADTFTYIEVDSHSGPITINLPDASSVSAGRYYLVKDIGIFASSNHITISPAGTDTIDNVASTIVIDRDGDSFFLVSNGAGAWFTTSRQLPATAIEIGGIALAGDLGGTANVPRVQSINGKVIPALGAPMLDGYVVQASDPSTLIFAPLALDNPNSVDGYLAGSNMAGATLTDRGAIVLAGDLDGYFAAPNVRSIFDATSLVVSSNVSLDATGRDFIVMVDTTASRSITLPSPATGRVFLIKDKSGQASTHPITIVRNGSEQIEGLSANAILSANGGSWLIFSDKTNWWIK